MNLPDFHRIKAAVFTQFLIQLRTFCICGSIFLVYSYPRSIHSPMSSKVRSPAGLLTFELMGECMERGYEYTRKMLPQIQKVLN